MLHSSIDHADYNLRLLGNSGVKGDYHRALPRGSGEHAEKDPLVNLLGYNIKGGR